MCDIFPEIEKCFCIGYRIAMLYISVLAIMTGILLCAMLQKETNTTFATTQNNINNVIKIKDPNEIMSHVGPLIPTSIGFMGVLFVIGGLLLLCGNVTDQEGIVQVFVWMTFFNVILGFIVVIAVGINCVTDTKNCLLKNMDWLTAATVLVFCTFYLILWIYFISIANTYVTMM